MRPDRSSHLTSPVEISHSTCFFFFFSSRRRHTRLQGDWSSDVCSSDLFRCWEPAGHGALTLSEAIAQSCDVYFYQLGLKLGLTSLLEDASQWGLRARTGIDLPGETASEFPSGTAYYDRAYGPRRWTSAVTLNLAIGQGENAQTLVDMVRLYQMLASDGR